MTYKDKLRERCESLGAGYQAYIHFYNLSDEDAILYSSRPEPIETEHAIVDLTGKQLLCKPTKEQNQIIVRQFDSGHWRRGREWDLFTGETVFELNVVISILEAGA